MKVIFFVFRMLVIKALLSLGIHLFADEIIRGTVMSVDGNNDRFTIQTENGKTMVVEVTPGDAEVNYLNKQIKGTLVQGQPYAGLEWIWPADPALEAQAQKYNAAQPVSTAQRKVGDMFPGFALYNQDGELITDKDLRGRLVVANFIFTRCMNPEMCPASTKRMAELQKLLKSKGLEDKVRLVTFTFDPERDTPGVLKHYANSYQITNDNYMFLTGDPQVVRNIITQLGVFTINRNGTISHTMNTLLLDENGKIIYNETGPKWKVNDFMAEIESKLAEQKKN